MVNQVSAARRSLQLLDNNKVIFVPNILMLISNFFFLVLFLWLTGFGETLFNVESLEGLGNLYQFFTITNLFYFLGYLLFVVLIDNFLSCSKYGMIKDLILKGRTTLESGFEFGKKFYFTTLRIHILVFLITIVPILLVGFVTLIVSGSSFMFITLPLFFILLIAYLIYVSIRLLFIYPVMAFEEKDAYQSFEQDVHYVKAHMHHTILTWLFVVGIGVAFSFIRKMSNLGIENLSGKVFFMALFFGFILIVLEMGVSIWEHIFIFESYVEGKLVKSKVVRKTVSRKKATIKRKKR